MLHRRTLLMTLAACGLVPGMGRAAPMPAPLPAPGAPSARLRALFDRFVQEQLQRNPEFATALGLDKGALAPLKAKLSDVSLAADAKDKRDTEARLAALKAIDRATLTGLDVSSYDTVMFVLQVSVDGANAFDYAGGSVQSPYVISQLVGAYHDVPDFLDTQHDIRTAADAEAYISRLAALATMMDQELERVQHDAKVGVVPPDFVIDKTLIQMKVFLDTPADKSTLVNSVVRRAKAAGLTGDYGTRATALYTGKILPALRRQSDHFTAARKTAVHTAGVARLPKGAEYYTLALKSYTTASIAPAQIHQTGLRLVAELTKGLDTALRAQGFKDGTVGQRLAKLGADKAYIYDDTDAAKVTLIADLNKKVTEVQAKLPQWFGALPKAKVEIRRVPKAIEAGAPGGYYEPGTLDGSRAGAYYINLRDTAEVPKWSLPTLTFHESIPGHHLQLTLAQEVKDLPLIRKIVFFSGYGEGWALYAEQLAVEMGMYDHDKLGHIGQMKDAMFRAVRLVVDSGMHAQGWTREQAVAYFVATLGDKESSAITEVERYCVWPGQACSYMVGKLTWLRLRAQAKKVLGPKFDIRKFHDAGLLSGALPLDVLDRVIGQYIATAKA
jgi:uncharacterized protein (DUF885 family)